MALTNYTIKTATYDFTCPACFIKVKRGDACLQDSDGVNFCFCQLPARRLTRIDEKTKKKRYVTYIQ